jgi:hypothetical protein
MSRADYILRAGVEGGLLIEGICQGRITYRGRMSRANYLLRANNGEEREFNTVADLLIEGECQGRITYRGRFWYEGISATPMTSPLWYTSTKQLGKA